MNQGTDVAEDKKLIAVLDLDNCLLHAREDVRRDRSRRVMRSDKIEERATTMVVSLSKQPGRTDDLYYVIKRPYLDLFISYISTHCKYVIVWSAGLKEYVHKIVDLLFRGHKKPNLILARDHLKYEDRAMRDYHKPLDVIKAKFPSYYDPKMMLFLDDKMDNFRSNASNGVTIPAFESGHKGDRCLYDMVQWLMSSEVKTATDVRDLDKTRIFTQLKQNRKVIDTVFEDSMSERSVITTEYRFLHRVC